MKKKLTKFLEALCDFGEFFISEGNVKKDYEFVTSILASQGYWAGIKYRLYFDNDLNFLGAEERW